MTYAAHKHQIPGYHTGLATTGPSRDMEIAGSVDGDIQARTVTVLESGSVDGMVGADSVIIRGAVRGIVEARSIELLATAHVEGELRYDNLKVASGAHMTARCVPAAA